jgi:hypothetical protein
MDVQLQYLQLNKKKKAINKYSIWPRMLILQIEHEFIYGDKSD